MQTQLVTDTENYPWLRAKDFFAESLLEDKIKRIANAALCIYGLLLPLLKKRAPIPRVCHYVLLSLLARKTLEAIAGCISYEAVFHYSFTLKEVAKKAHRAFIKKQFVFREVELHLGGTSFAATVVVHRSHMDSKVCTIHLRGINKAYEIEMLELAKIDKKIKSYSLFVNGPRVGKSSGLPTSSQLSAVAQAALQYAEKALQSKKIIVSGHSFGGAFGTVGLAKHIEKMKTYGSKYDIEKNDVEYLALSHCSFGDLISTAARIKAPILRPIFKAIGFQVDNIKASKELSDNNIWHVVIQGEDESDKIVPDEVALATILKAQNITHRKIFITAPNITHSDYLPKEAQIRLDLVIESFIAGTLKGLQA